MRFLILELSILTAKNGKDYMNMKVRDENKVESSGKYWGVVDGIKTGNVVTGVFKNDSYNGMPQTVFSRIELDENQATGSFEKATMYDVDKMWSSIIGLVDSMESPLIKYVTSELLMDNLEAFKVAPAAKTVHNAWKGGLIEHVESLCFMAVSLVDHYKRRYQVEINRDLVLFGCMIHDLAKVVEYDYTSQAYNLSGEGVLTNHLVLGPAWVYHKAMSFTGEKDNELISHMMHVLAAHHGKIDWGSPVVPSSMEAILVHHLDNIDAKMMHAIELISGDDGPIKGFSKPSYFEKTQFLKPKEKAF